jgi:hypothetical protein
MPGRNSVACFAGPESFSAALVKSKAELTNPEKSLVGTIRSPFPGEADRTFRYVPVERTRQTATGPANPKIRASSLGTCVGADISSDARH